ncbi:MAG TPA: hypothetical protein VKA43_14545 [Gammaproteobacteria bacterium]|nr:hypothetical protein [Gammaproteobacteria bacterium]
MLRTWCTALVIGLMLTAPAVAQAPMTNQSVIDLAKAKMSDDIILAAIRGSKPSFDLSADGLIALKNAGVSDAVLQEMLRVNSGGAAASAAAGAAVAGGLNPEEVVLIDGGTEQGMKYLSPQLRAAARALGFGGMAQYAVLAGEAARLRTSKTPKFRIAVPNNAQPESYFTLASFAVRNNGSREVQVGGGYISYSTGINRDRVVPVSYEQAADQSKAPANFTIYEVTSDKALDKGEYAVVLYSSQIRSTGYFLSGLDSYFDFGVD